eukprot:scaffold19271_cov28-Tisochrysis_lutea.AAC.2
MRRMKARPRYSSRGVACGLLARSARARAQRGCAGGQVSWHRSDGSSRPCGSVRRATCGHAEARAPARARRAASACACARAVHAPLGQDARAAVQALRHPR